MVDIRSSSRVNRWLSTRIHDVSIGMSRRTALTTTPVRPIPPAVAQNSSGSRSGATVITPLGVTRVISTTCRAKLPVAMVVLSVDVRGDGTADRDIAGPRRHRHEPARRNEAPHQVVQADAPTDLDRPHDLVQRADVAESRCVDGEPTGALRGVAVAPPEAAGDDAAGWSQNEAKTEDTSTGRLTRAVVGVVLPQPHSGTGQALDGDRHPYRPMPMRASQSTP